jgi:O-glycosyl hydrolase
LLKLCLCALSVGILIMYCSNATYSVQAQRRADTVILLDGRDSGRLFEGLGAVSAGASSRLLIDYPEPQRSQILDYLFKPGYGAALQHLKVEIGSDVNSTDGSEPSHMRSPTDHDYTRGYEWWLMEEAKKRNPNIILDILPWGAPGWIGDGHLYSSDMADYVADFIKGAARVHHLQISYVGIANERMYDSNYVKELDRVLRREHLSTRIVCCDAYGGGAFSEYDIVNAIAQDPSLKQAIAAIGVHYPHEPDSSSPAEAARQLGLPLWSSEDQPNGGSGPFISRDWPQGGRILAQKYIRNYLEDRFTKTEIWSPITSYYDILAAPNSGLMYANTPWSGHYEVQGAIWATAHTTQFAQPDWQYLDAASGKLADQGTFVSLRSPNRKDWSVVLETIAATSPQTVTFRIAGGLSSATIHIWETNDSHTFDHVSDIEVKDGSFTYTFDPASLYTLTTTTGQGKGTAVPPPSKDFPMPYGDGFEKTARHRSPKYLSDQDGAFEVESCMERQGSCLEQVLSRKPIPWGPLPDPFTITGNIDWKDYSVAADVRLPRYGAATLMARIDSADVFKDGNALYPGGYVLKVSADGHWELISTGYNRGTVTLASGVTTVLDLGWHHLELKCQGDTIEPFLDSKSLAHISDHSHTHGMVALGSDWSHVQFDNFLITP